MEKHLLFEKTFNLLGDKLTNFVDVDPDSTQKPKVSKDEEKDM